MPTTPPSPSSCSPTTPRAASSAGSAARTLSVPSAKWRPVPSPPPSPKLPSVNRSSCVPPLPQTAMPTLSATSSVPRPTLLPFLPTLLYSPPSFPSAAVRWQMSISTVWHSTALPTSAAPPSTLRPAYATAATRRWRNSPYASISATANGQSPRWTSHPTAPPLLPSLSPYRTTPSSSDMSRPPTTPSPSTTASISPSP